MGYLPVKEITVLWKISERSVQNYCTAGRVPGAFLVGKTWNIPENADKPERKGKSVTECILLSVLQDKIKRIRSGV